MVTGQGALDLPRRLSKVQNEPFPQYTGIVYFSIDAVDIVVPQLCANVLQKLKVSSVGRSHRPRQRFDVCARRYLFQSLRHLLIHVGKISERAGISDGGYRRFPVFVRELRKSQCRQNNVNCSTIECPVEVIGCLAICKWRIRVTTAAYPLCSTSSGKS